MAIIYPEGTQTKVIKIQRFEYSSLAQLPNRTAEYDFWSETYSRQNSGSSLMIESVLPGWELPNGPYLGVRMSVNGYKHAKGLLHFRPNSDTTSIGYNCIVTSGEIGSTTGNITISQGWFWHRASSDGRPMNRTNLSGGSGAGNYDNRVGSSARTHGNMIVTEFIP
tara:strand:- start:193 stop:690 length:498 start_codon:yes stop_codon:yes gene_type:complete